jgi:hypothetical protein
MSEVEMNIKAFTEKEREILSHNYYIKTVGMKSLTYTEGDNRGRSFLSYI